MIQTQDIFRALAVVPDKKKQGRIGAALRQLTIQSGLRSR